MSYGFFIGQSETKFQSIHFIHARSSNTWDGGFDYEKAGRDLSIPAFCVLAMVCFVRKELGGNGYISTNGNQKTEKEPPIMKISEEQSLNIWRCR